MAITGVLLLKIATGTFTVPSFFYETLFMFTGVKLWGRALRVQTYDIPLHPPRLLNRSFQNAGTSLPIAAGPTSAGPI